MIFTALSGPSNEYGSPPLIYELGMDHLVVQVLLQSLMFDALQYFINTFQVVLSFAMKMLNGPLKVSIHWLTLGKLLLSL